MAMGERGFSRCLLRKNYERGYIIKGKRVKNKGKIEVSRG
jgi:hypothetical protein